MLGRQEFVLVRHGQSTANAAGIWQGRLDFPLSDEGREQARLAGKALASEKFDALYASPLSRAYETAEIIAREAGFGREPTPEPGLVERAGGLLEGTTREEREARIPELARKLSTLPEEERWSVVGAETDGEVLGRFGGAISKIRVPPRGGEPDRRGLARRVYAGLSEGPVRRRPPRLTKDAERLYYPF